MTESLRSKYNFGLVGFPLEHSLSPILHRAALAAAGLMGSYRLFPVSPATVGQGLPALLQQIRQGNLHGLNVTIPYKQQILPLLDELNPVAAAVGAVNTVYMKDDTFLQGDNTDIPGFLSALKALPEPGSGPPAYALILGAGGAARATAYALATAGWQVCLAARRPDSAHAIQATLETHLPQATIQVAEFPVSNTIPNWNDIALVVNATPLGMWPNVDHSPWPAALPFPRHARVLDLVYNPIETKFLKAARLQGLTTSNGLEMLVEQAALSFERWTGVTASRQAMRAALAVD